MWSLHGGVLPAWAAEPAGSVVCDGGRLSVDVRAEPLESVLGRVAQECGIDVITAGALEQPVTLRIADADLRSGLRRLLWGQDYIIDEPEAGGGPVSVRILGPSGAAPRVLSRTAAPGPGVPEELRIALRHPDADTRLEAVTIIGDGGDPRAAAWLAPLLSDPDDGVRAAAFASLAQLGSDDAARALAAALRDPREDVRTAAVDALDHIGSPGAIALLAPALVDADDGVRDAAFAAVAGHGDADAVAGALAVTLKDQRATVRLAAVEALVDVPGNAATALLRQAASDPDPGVRETAAEALKSRAAD